MEKELALHVVRTAFRSAGSLEELLPLPKQHCDEKEYNEFRMAIANAIYNINSELMNRTFSTHPQLEEEVESKIRKYGRLL